MEGVAAFAVACNILQIVESSRTIVKTAKEIRSSRNGMTSEHEDSRKTAEQLHDLATGLQQNGEHKKLQEITGRWQAALDKHLALLSTLSRKGSNSYLQATLVAVELTWKKEKLDQSQVNIARLSGEVNTYLSTVYLLAISRKQKVIGDDIAALDGRLERDMAAEGQQLKRIDTVAQGTSDTASKAKDLIEQLNPGSRSNENGDSIISVYTYCTSKSLTLDAVM
jgi:hypothetical protein